MARTIAQLTAATPGLYTASMSPLPSTPLYLAIVVHDLSATGVVRNAIRIAGHMANHGYRTELWVIRDSGAFRAQVPPAVTIRMIGARKIKTVRRIETLLAVKTIAGLIALDRPQVVLSAGNHFHLACSEAYSRAGCPPDTQFMGRASNATPRLGRKIPGIAWLADTIDALKYRNMHKVIAVSHELAADLNQRLGIAEDRIAVISNGVDLATIARLAAEPLDDPWFAATAPPVIISAGRISRQKNYALLLEAFARLRQKRPVRLVILGQGSDNAVSALQRQAKTLDVADDLRLHGFEANPMRFFGHAGVFVLSSLWEGASNALLEAMACGCPVVATDCPTGVREQLDNGRIGPIVPLGDPEALARAIDLRLDQPRAADALKAHAATFDHGTMLAAYERLFRGETSGGRGSAASSMESSSQEI